MNRNCHHLLLLSLHHSLLGSMLVLQPEGWVFAFHAIQRRRMPIFGVYSVKDPLGGGSTGVRGFAAELEREDFDEIFGDYSKSIVHESELPGNLFSIIFGDVLVDFKVHVAVHHLVGVDILVVRHFLHFLLHHRATDKTITSFTNAQ